MRMAAMVPKLRAQNPKQRVHLQLQQFNSIQFNSTQPAILVVQLPPHQARWQWQSLGTAKTSNEFTAAASYYCLYTVQWLERRKYAVFIEVMTVSLGCVLVLSVHRRCRMLAKTVERADATLTAHVWYILYAHDDFLHIVQVLSIHTTNYYA